MKLSTKLLLAVLAGSLCAMVAAGMWAHSLALF
jgi:hypothetical protein